MVRALIAIAALFAATAWADGRPLVKLQPSVERSVVNVLHAKAAMRAARDSEETWRAFDRALDPLLEKRNKRTDKALAALVSFYIGEHPSEDITCELVSRGRRVLPLLKFFRDHQSRFLANRLTVEEKRAEYDSLIKRIRAREKCTREP